MSSTAKNPSTGRTGSCPYTLASPGMSPRKSRTGGPISFKSTPPPIIAQTRVSRRFQRFRPPFTRTLVTREVIKRALELGASALILVHNHPSGDPTPSGSDVSVTKDIVKAAAPLGVTVHDHLIIGRGHHSSLRDLGLI